MGKFSANSKIKYKHNENRQQHFSMKIYGMHKPTLVTQVKS